VGGRTLGVVTAVVFAAAFAAPASARPIWYFFEGNGSGSVGSRTFSDGDFVITARGDTDNVSSLPELPKRWDVPVDSRIRIEGIGEGAITRVTRVGSYPGAAGVFFGRERDIFDIFGIQEPPLADYSLRSEIGPIREDNPIAVNQFFNVQSELGIIRFNSIDYINFSASFVPEPGAAAALLLPGTSLLLRRRGRTS
jgi:hypothetical protein